MDKAIEILEELLRQCKEQLQHETPYTYNHGWVAGEASILIKAIEQLKLEDNKISIDTAAGAIEAITDVDSDPTSIRIEMNGKQFALVRYNPQHNGPEIEFLKSARIRRPEQ